MKDGHNREDRPGFGRRILVWCACGLALVVGLGAAPLKYTEDRPPATLNPVFADDMYSVRMVELIFDGLLGYDKEQRVVACLAKRWAVAPDKKSITFDLRPGVKWHDGKPFTAADVAFTIKTMTSNRVNLTDRYLSGIVKRITVLGPLKIKVFFKKRLAKPELWFTFKIIPKHRFKGTVRRSHYFSQKPYGTGPFRHKTWEGKKIVLKRNPHYFKRVSLSGVQLQAIPDKNIQVEVLRYGGLDAIIRVRPKDIPIFERDANTQLYPYSTNDWWYLGLNHKRGSPFRDRRVREAFVLALDRQKLREAHLGEGQVISGPYSPNSPYYNFAVAARRQNLGKAKQLLEKAGWKTAAGSPFRKKGRKQLAVEFLVAKSKTSYKAMCLAIQSYLRKVGIQVKIRWLEDAAWSRRVMRQKKYDMVLHIWNFDDLSTIYPLFHSRGSRNYIGYRNREVDRLLRQAANATDPEIYKAIHAKLHLLLHREVPYIFLWSLTNYSAVSAKVKRVTIHPFNYFHFAHEWKKVSGD